jgi:hypothetical protein
MQSFSLRMVVLTPEGLYTYKNTRLIPLRKDPEKKSNKKNRKIKS